MKKLLTLLFLCSTSIVFGMSRQEQEELKTLMKTIDFLITFRKDNIAGYTPVGKWCVSKGNDKKFAEFEALIITAQARVEQIIQGLEPKKPKDEDKND